MDQPIKIRRKLRAIDVESGIGGMTMGFSRVGYNVDWVSDSSDKMRELLENNLCTNLSIKTRIEKQTTKINKIPHPDVIIGTLRNDTKMENIEKIIIGIKPRVLCFEVFKNDITPEYWKKLGNIGYNCHEGILDALDFGLRQRRLMKWHMCFRPDYKASFHGFPFPPFIRRLPDPNLITYASVNRFVPKIWRYFMKTKRKKLTMNEMYDLMGLPRNIDLGVKAKRNKFIVMGETTCPPVAASVAYELADWIIL